MNASDRLVVDASVAVKWYVPEVGSETASALLESGTSLIAPDLLIAEFGNVIWKKVRKKEIDQAEAAEIIGALLASGPVLLRPAGVLLSAAFEISIRHNLTVYDALYVAAALQESCPLVTADERLRQALSGTNLEKRVLVLADLK